MQSRPTASVQDTSRLASYCDCGVMGHSATATATYADAKAGSY